LPGFKRAKQRGEIVDATKATAHLPGLEIEIVHRQSPAGDSEQLSINLQAVPSFEAFGRFLEAANPFAFWALAWSPWVDIARTMMLPGGLVPLLPKPDSEAMPRASEQPASITIAGSPGRTAEDGDR
jgi:hypothetical protein